MAQTDHRQTADFHSRTFLSHRLENGIALPADRQAIAGIFDIAAQVNATRDRLEGTADLEFGIRRIRSFSNGLGLGKKIWHAATIA